MSSASASAIRPPLVVKTSNVSKRFTIRKDNSLKERIVTFGKAGKQHREEFWALQDINLEINAGETIGLIGHNGSGKSTLLKVLGGIIDPTDGTVERRGRVAALLELGAGFHPDLTGRENIYLNASVLGLTKKDTDERFDAIVAFSEIGEFIDTQVKFYSSGMYVRLAFAVAVHTDPDILIVDEVLAVGDEAFQRKCLNKIKTFQSEGRTIILVSHAMGQVQELCNRAVLLDRGKVISDGDPIDAIAAFRNALDEHQQERLQQERINQERLEDERKEREHLEQAKRQEQERQEKKEKDAEPKALILSAKLRTPKHGVTTKRNSILNPGDDIFIDMDFTSDEPLHNWICGVQIDNSFAQKIYGTDTLNAKISLNALNSRTSLTLHIKSPQFGTGKYFINISLMDEYKRHMHDLIAALSFEVRAPRTASGSVWAESEFSLGSGTQPE